MLRSFQVTNHKSIKSEQELQLIPAHDKTRQAVPVAAIYGANASGKSNLLHALAFMRRAVRESFRVWDAKSGIPRSPFALDLSGRLDPSSFVVELNIDDVDYLYGFVVDDVRVVDEWLYSYPRKKKRVIFERSGMDVILGSTIPEQASKADLLRKLLRENSLVSSAAAQAAVLPEAEPVSEWFRSHLRTPDASWQWEESAMIDLISSAISRHPEFPDLVRAADLGLTEIRVDTAVEPPHEETSEVLRQIEQLNRAIRSRTENPVYSRRLREMRDVLSRPAVRRELVFVHGEASVAMSSHDQSQGTLSWLQLLPQALDTLADRSVLIVDELDSSLHPRLIARLIELFRDKHTNPGGAQLVFTTHDATLLGTNFGREILARDEIWFVEKDEENISKLIALTDYHPRKEDNRERRYLSGSYGGVPAVFSDTFVETMLKVRTEARDAAA